MAHELDWEGNRPSRREQLIELAVFLFLIVPSLVLSFFVVNQGNVSFILVAISTILRDLALVSLLFFFIWRNGEPLAALGWSWGSGWREVLLGLALFVPMTMGTGLLESFLQSIGLSATSPSQALHLTPSSVAGYIWAVILVIVVAVAEETIFRGYLILRFEALPARPLVAALLSALVFSLGHGYEGSAGVITVGVMGFVLALIYLWRKSLVAPVIIHLLQDLLSIVLVPLLK